MMMMKDVKLIVKRDKNDKNFTLFIVHIPAKTFIENEKDKSIIAKQGLT